MEILPQIILISIIQSAIYALIAAGLTLTFGTLEFVNFAHGEMAMAGAFIFYNLYIVVGLPLILSVILTVLIVAVLGLIIEKTTFRPVRDKQEFIPLVLSIGIAIIFASGTIMLFGSGSKSYSQGQTPTVYTFFDKSLTISQSQIVIIISAIILISALMLFLKKTKIGKAIRAVSDNKEVAAIMGINVNRTIATIFAIGSGLAAIAGILIAFDQNLHPRMGMMLSIKAFAAIVLGGVGYLNGALIGAIVIGFAENMIVGLTPISASYKELIVFVILILVLIFKPYGIFGGRKEEIESR